MDYLTKQITDFKENSVKLNDLYNQRKTAIKRLDGFFKGIWIAFTQGKQIAVPDNKWHLFGYKGFKIKGNSVRIIGHAPYCALEDRTVNVPLSVISKGPNAVGGFLARKIHKDVIEAAERQKREDEEANNNAELKFIAVDDFDVLFRLLFSDH